MNGKLLPAIGINNAFLLCPSSAGGSTSGSISFGEEPLAGTKPDNEDNLWCSEPGVYAKSTKYLTPLILKSLMF